jgi:hypothetical protein
MDNDELEQNNLDTNSLDKDAIRDLLLLQSVIEKMYPYKKDEHILTE